MTEVPNDNHNDATHEQRPEIRPGNKPVQDDPTLGDFTVDPGRGTEADSGIGGGDALSGAAFSDPHEETADDTGREDSPETTERGTAAGRAVVEHETAMSNEGNRTEGGNPLDNQGKEEETDTAADNGEASASPTQHDQAAETAGAVVVGRETGGEEIPRPEIREDDSIGITARITILEPELTMQKPGSLDNPALKTRLEQTESGRFIVPQIFEATQSNNTTLQDLPARFSTQSRLPGGVSNRTHDILIGQISLGSWDGRVAIKAHNTAETEVVVNEWGAQQRVNGLAQAGLMPPALTHIGFSKWNSGANGEECIGPITIFEPDLITTDDVLQSQTASADDISQYVQRDAQALALLQANGLTHGDANTGNFGHVHGTARYIDLASSRSLAGIPPAEVKRLTRLDIYDYHASLNDWGLSIPGLQELNLKELFSGTYLEAANSTASASQLPQAARLTAADLKL